MDTTNPASESEYLGITEAADYLRVSASTLRRWEKKGFLVPERTPTGIRRYTKKQLDDVIQTPAYEKPVVTPQPAMAPPPVSEMPAAAVVPPEPHIQVEPTIEQTYQVEETIDEYIHVVEPDSEERLAQHTIDSQFDARPASFTSANIDHGYTPLEYSHDPVKDKDPFESFSYTKENRVEDQPPIKSVAPDNFATVEQQQFNHIFDIHENENMDEQVELEEYDTDAAYVSDDPRTSTYSYGAQTQEVTTPKQKKKQTWVKPVFLFISLFLAIVIISMVAWFALSSSPVNGAPLNPVIE